MDANGSLFLGCFFFLSICDKCNGKFGKIQQNNEFFRLTDDKQFELKKNREKKIKIKLKSHHSSSNRDKKKKKKRKKTVGKIVFFFHFCLFALNAYPSLGFVCNHFIDWPTYTLNDGFCIGCLH